MVTQLFKPEDFQIGDAVDHFIDGKFSDTIFVSALPVEMTPGHTYFLKFRKPSSKIWLYGLIGAVIAGYIWFKRKK